MRHLAPTRAIREMAQRGEIDVDALMRRFRHHSRRELDLRAPRWDEDRAFVEELAASYTGLGRRRPAACVRGGAGTGAGARCRGIERRSFGRKLDRLRRFVWLREEMRDLSTRLYYQIRRHVLEIARRRGLGDDIFFMTFQEIIADDRAQHRAQPGDVRELSELQGAERNRRAFPVPAVGWTAGGAAGHRREPGHRRAAWRASRARSRRRRASRRAPSWSAPSPIPAGR